MSPRPIDQRHGCAPLRSTPDPGPINLSLQNPKPCHARSQPKQARFLTDHIRVYIYVYTDLHRSYTYIYLAKEEEAEDDVTGCLQVFKFVPGCSDSGESPDLERTRSIWTHRVTRTNSVSSNQTLQCGILSSLALACSTET